MKIDEMSLCVKLNDIIDCVGFLTYDTAFYLDKESGELIPVSREELRAAKEGGALENYPEWQKTRINLVIEILDDKNEEKYIAIPEWLVNHEYSTMENFCLLLKDEKISNPLCSLILGRSARRRFINGVHHFGVAEEWYTYRYRAMRRIVIAWCEANNIEYIED